jgi:hypothetical protein
MSVTVSFGQSPYVLTIQVTTDVEAVEILKKLGMTLTAQQGDGIMRFPRHVTHAALKQELPEQAYRLFKILASRSEDCSSMDSSDVAKALGVDPPAIGPFVAELLRWAEQRGFKKERVIINGRRRKVGRLTRTLRLGPVLDHAAKEFLTTL